MTRGTAAWVLILGGALLAMASAQERLVDPTSEEAPAADDEHNQLEQRPGRRLRMGGESLQYSNFAYRLGVNLIVYGMSH